MPTLLKPAQSAPEAPVQPVPKSTAELRAEWEQLPTEVRAATMAADEVRLTALDSRKRVLPVLILRSVLRDAESVKERVDAHHAVAVTQWREAEALRDAEHIARNAAQAKLDTAQSALSERESEMRAVMSYQANARNAVQFANAALGQSADNPQDALAMLDDRILPLLKSAQNAEARLEAEGASK